MVRSSHHTGPLERRGAKVTEQLITRGSTMNSTKNIGFMSFIRALWVAIGACIFVSPAIAELPAPTVFADINLTTQRMTVSDKSGVLYKWKISSAGGGYVTPIGVYRPQWISAMHYSKQYYNAPMPYSVFFHRGYAIHGTVAVERLGRPASHGCVRLATPNAKKFFDLVQKRGKELVRITVHGTPPPSPRVDDELPYVGDPPFELYSANNHQPPTNQRSSRWSDADGYSAW
jgi:lipoprotein-anchoring transpeptidase ErfK/SrfK